MSASTAKLCRGHPNPDDRKAQDRPIEFESVGVDLRAESPHRVGLDYSHLKKRTATKPKRTVYAAIVRMVMYGGVTLKAE